MLDQRTRSVLRVPRRTALDCNPNCNPQIRGSGHIVQDRPPWFVRWADTPELSVRVGRCPPAWQQCWQQSPNVPGPGCGPCAPPLPPIGLTAADPFAGGKVARVASRVRSPGIFICARSLCMRTRAQPRPTVVTVGLKLRRSAGGPQGTLFRLAAHLPVWLPVGAPGGGHHPGALPPDVRSSVGPGGARPPEACRPQRGNQSFGSAGPLAAAIRPWRRRGPGVVDCCRVTGGPEAKIVGSNPAAQLGWRSPVGRIRRLS
jgi:hypothetical protein